MFWSKSTASKKRKLSYVLHIVRKYASGDACLANTSRMHNVRTQFDISNRQQWRIHDARMTEEDICVISQHSLNAVCAERGRSGTRRIISAADRTTTTESSRQRAGADIGDLSTATHRRWAIVQRGSGDNGRLDGYKSPTTTTDCDVGTTTRYHHRTASLSRSAEPHSYTRL